MSSLLPLHYALIALLLGAVAWFWRPAIFPIWILSFMVFPTARVKLGGAPLFLFDATMLAVIGLLWLRRGFVVWPQHLPRWHWWMSGAAFLFSVVFGTLRYGFSAEMLWIWGHTALAWMGFAIGVVLVLGEHGREYRQAMQWGFLLSAAVLCAIAVVQYADLPASGAINSFFYGSLGVEESSDMLRVGVMTNRANGPHFAPTGFAGIVLLAAVTFWLISDREDRVKRFVILGLSAATILCTVSRHAVLAAAAGIVVSICFAEQRARIKLLAACAGVALLVGLAAGGAMLQESWGVRMARFDEGVLADENIIARVFTGPERLGEFFSQHPSMLLTGAGLDPEKLMVRAGIAEEFDSGFVSNGFLLALYYLGVGGCAVYAIFWIWAFRAAATGPRETRALMLGCVTICGIIVAADNYSLMYEPVSALLFLIVGLIAGQRENCDFDNDELEDSEALEEHAA